MAEHPPQEENRGGERRGSDRRTADRRKADRRLPRPWWRRSWAMVAYGVLGALALVVLWNSLDSEEPLAPRDERLVSRTNDSVPVEEATPPAPGPLEAYGTAGFEQLAVEGEAAVGRVVRAELFCEPPTSYSLVPHQSIPPGMAPLVQEGHVAAAECKWGPQNEPRRAEFLLLVPQELAGDYTAAPVVSDAFVERRRIIAELEWLGRPQALALRHAGVFRGLVTR